MEEIGKIIVFTGILITILGLGILLLGKLPGIGRLPGDVLIKKDNFVFYLPLATSILLSILLTIILNIFFRR